MADGYNHEAMAMTGLSFEATPDSAVAADTLHSELKNFRISKRESQEKFWARFGVTQSSGSRFETGLGIPAPVAILVKLYVKGLLSDGDLQGLASPC